MTTIFLSGHKWRAVSPSTYTLDGYPVWLAYRPRAVSGEARQGEAGWYLAINGDYDGARPWPSRDCAAAAIAQAFLEHELFGEEAL